MLLTCLYAEDEFCWQCEYCAKKYRTKRDLTYHQRTKHLSGFKYNCISCGLGLRNEEELKTHMCPKKNPVATAKMSTINRVDLMRKKNNVDEPQTMVIFEEEEVKFIQHDEKPGAPAFKAVDLLGADVVNDVEEEEEDSDAGRVVICEQGDNDDTVFTELQKMEVIKEEEHTMAGEGNCGFVVCEESAVKELLAFSSASSEMMAYSNPPKSSQTNQQGLVSESSCSSSATSSLSSSLPTTQPAPKAETSPSPYKLSASPGGAAVNQDEACMAEDGPESALATLADVAAKHQFSCEFCGKGFASASGRHKHLKVSRTKCILYSRLM